MPLETLFSNPLPAIPPSRSLISRLTSPLGKRNRNIADFSIEPDHPYKAYTPGELVKGNVLLTVAKGFDVTHLVTCLHGYAKVYKNQVVPGEGVVADGILDIRGGNQGVEYRGNGLVSLFQDEVALCGDGFLKKGVYKFGFELEFPPKSLPSSIDFERGTISYFISATLTRPTSITPTVSCHRRVTFRDSIDVGNVSTPKPRVITLEPISKRGRVKARVRPSSLEKAHDNIPRVQISRTNTDSSTSSNRPLPEIQVPQSPAPSEITAVSQTSTSTRSFRIVEHPSSGDTASQRDSETRSSVLSSASQTITATTEIEKQGALPGDTIPIRVSVAHTKPNVRGLVIATLYRQGRIDMHPAIPIVSKGKNRKAEYEDVYPRSKSGLGGLYFSSGSPSSVFRKDLSQSTAMMIINPQSLSAEIKTSIKLPEAAFPTTTNVPGGMISFKYYIEVVVDLCGKLGESRFLPRLTSSEPSFTDGADNTNQLNSDWANHILDTVQLRRTKSVVDFTFSVIVGTKDSVRTARRLAGETYRENAAAYDSYVEGPYPEHDRYDGNGEDHTQWDGYNGQDDHERFNKLDENPLPPHMQAIAIPPQETPVSEKDRLRQAEALLLPSQPPEEGDSYNTDDATAPSAPHEADLYGYDGPSLPQAGPSRIPTRSFDTVVPTEGPSHDPPAFENGTGADRSQDDKQDLERQRLLAQASAPMEEEERGDSRHEFAPTAPVLEEWDEYNAHTFVHDHDHNHNQHHQHQRQHQYRQNYASAGENLPRYQR